MSCQKASGKGRDLKSRYATQNPVTKIISAEFQVFFIMHFNDSITFIVQPRQNPFNNLRLQRDEARLINGVKEADKTPAEGENYLLNLSSN